MPTDAESVVREAVLPFLVVAFLAAFFALDVASEDGTGEPLVITL